MTARADPRRLTSLGPSAEFEGGWRPLAGFLVVITALLLLVNGGRAALFGQDVSPGIDVSVTVFGTALTGVVAWLALRTEGVRLGDIGLARAQVAPGVAAVAGLWIGLNLAGLGLAVLTGNGGSVGYLYDEPVLLLAAGVIEQYLVVGLLEELAYRGYLQNKLVGGLGGRDDRAAVLLGIALMAVVFAATHVPNRLFVDGLAPGDLPASLAPLVVAAVLYGVLYEATGNLVLVGLLHGTFNQWPLFVDPRLWPTQLLLAWVAIGVGLLAVVVWAYRRSHPGADTGSGRGARL